MRRPYLLPFLDSPAGANDNFVSSLESDHLRHAVGGTRVVDVPCGTSRQGSIDDVVVVNAEHVHPAVLKHRIERQARVGFQ